MGAAGLSRGRFDLPPVLVTGAPRSGTTFLGDVLAAAPGVRFVYEPFNAQIGMSGIPQQFTYVAPGSRYEPVVAPLVEELLHGRAHFHTSTIDAPASGPKKLVRAALGSRTQLRYRADVLRGGERWLLKDPLAAFSAEWLHRRFAAPTVVAVRHPAAVVHSYLRLGWTFGLEDLAAQPELVDAFDLGAFVGRGGGYERVESAARLWAALYTVLGTVADRNDGVMTVRHEDVSAQPDRWFARLYAHTGLRYDERAQRHVQAVTGDQNPAAPDDDAVHTLRRDSRADLGRWKRDLALTDAATIRRVTEPVAARWYADDEW